MGTVETARWSPLADTINVLHSPNFGYPGKRPRWRAVTWHIAEGTLEGTLSWLTAPVSQASAHVVIGRAGEIYNLVPLDDAAWCQGRTCDPDRGNPIVEQTVAIERNPNLVSYSIECVGYSSHGHGGSLTGAQADALVRVTAFLCKRSTLSADAAHILRHSQWDACTRGGCPGFSTAEMNALVARVQALCQLWRGW